MYFFNFISNLKKTIKAKYKDVELSNLFHIKNLNNTRVTRKQYKQFIKKGLLII